MVVAVSPFALDTAAIAGYVAWRSRERAIKALLAGEGGTVGEPLTPIVRRMPEAQRSVLVRLLEEQADITTGRRSWWDCQ